MGHARGALDVDVPESFQIGRFSSLCMYSLGVLDASVFPQLERSTSSSLDLRHGYISARYRIGEGFSIFGQTDGRKRMNGSIKLSAHGIHDEFVVSQINLGVFDPGACPRQYTAGRVMIDVGRERFFTRLSCTKEGQMLLRFRHQISRETCSEKERLLCFRGFELMSLKWKFNSAEDV